MEKNITLDQLECGQKGMVQRLTVSGEQRRRLQDIGLIEGTVVTCIQKSPGGDPVAYFIRGAVIALRKDIAEKIEICCNLHQREAEG